MRFPRPLKHSSSTKQVFIQGKKLKSVQANNKTFAKDSHLEVLINSVKKWKLSTDLMSIQSCDNEVVKKFSKKIAKLTISNCLFDNH
jgi:hypothetical protein